MKLTPVTSMRGRRRINTRQLEAFYSVSVAGTVSAAAEMLSLTQPAVSKQIAALEKEIGYALFRRDGGRLVMTHEARYLFDEVTSTLSHLDTLWDAMTQVKRLNVGRLEIGTPPGPSYLLLPRLLRQFLQHRPEVEVQLHAVSSTIIQRNVSLQQLDLGIVEGVPPSPNYDAIPLDVECVCAVSRHSALAEKSVLTPADLDGFAAVTLERQHPIVRKQEAIFSREGAVFNPRYEVSLWWAGLGLVREQLCYALIDKINATAFQEIEQANSIVFVPFKPDVTYTMAIIVPNMRPMSALTETFLDLLLNELNLPKPHQY